MPPGGFYSDDHSPIVSPDLYGPPLHPINTHSTENFNHYTEFEDSVPPLISPVEGSKSKRRQSQLDHVKHKRTRSGCFTCRSRRVKCDEAHPTCERCRKGQRDCVYPDSNNQRPPRDLSKYKTATADSGSSGDEGDDKQKTSAAPEEENEEGSGSITAKAAKQAHDSMSPSSKERDPISPTESTKKSAPKRPQASRTNSKQPKLTSLGGPKWATLPKDIRTHIKYHREHITCHHYSLKHDNSNFLKTTFLEIALSYEPLLYAITAFSAYFSTISRPDGNLQSFLSYYNKSVSLLRESLSKASRHSTATLLTILQLATFEEYLGDWVNVFSHTKAAYEILIQLFTPETIMQNETRRKIISWYMRFDLLTGFISSSETALPREWHEAVTNYYVRQAADRPQDLGCQVEEALSTSVFLAYDMSVLFGRMARNSVPDAELLQSLSELRQRVAERDAILDAALADKKTYVEDFPPLSEGEIDLFDSKAQDFLIDDPLRTWNLVLNDWWAIKGMFLGMDRLSPSSPMQLGLLGRRICQMFEGYIRAGNDRQADVLAMHSSLGIAMTTLPRDEPHMLWARRTLALVESCGYFQPSSYRTRMSEVWGKALTDDWWQADIDSPLLQQIREFINYRALNPNDAQTDSLRDLRPVFKAMSLEDDPHRNTGGRVTRSASSVTTEENGSSMGGGDLWAALDSSPEMNWDAHVGSSEVAQGEWS
ncbi:hypothetical protein K461DRAFT_227541 [Myriangium duriaei CBS 260.36]|uniref:Zn(2)-C6 fungal-type domain-containing protein n=1 Tax=Myriangium duriaei CBS 260.36 TaxID=1168546 RepID=A0A9P4J028_9PEZI|nr:hypothetical protein K461DRAFT_227541 [Myriangium duriaei CBS 260.36]